MVVLVSFYNPHRMLWKADSCNHIVKFLSCTLSNQPRSKFLNNYNPMSHVVKLVLLKTPFLSGGTEIAIFQKNFETILFFKIICKIMLLVNSLFVNTPKFTFNFILCLCVNMWLNYHIYTYNHHGFLVKRGFTI